MTPKTVKVFVTKEGRKPFIEWLQALRDQRAKQRIQVRIDRLSLGALGHTRSVGEGVGELKIDYGPGYRVYFGLDGNAIVVLLCGGDKDSQYDDIKKAKTYWKEFKEERTNAQREL